MIVRKPLEPGLSAPTNPVTPLGGLRSPYRRASRGRRLVQLLLAAGLYTLLSLIGFLPGALRLFHDWFLWFEDPTNCYRIWWFSRVLHGQGGSIWYLPDLLYPFGIETMMQSNGLGKELVFALLGFGRAPWLAGTLMALSTPITVSLVGFVVIRRMLHGAFWPALIAGWYLGWSGTMIGHLVFPWMASLEGLVLFVWALWNLRRTGRRRWAVVAGLAAALAIWLQIQQLVYLLVVSFLFLYDRRILRDWRGVRFLGWSGLIALALTLPLLIHTWISYGGSVEQMGGTTFAASIFRFRTSLSQLLVPPEGSLPLGSLSTLLRTSGLPHTANPLAYLGWGVLVLAFLGWRTRHRGTGFLAVVAIVGVLLSCGPVISLFNAPARPQSVFGATWILGPFSLIGDVPVFGSMRVPARFVVLAQVSLGMLAAFGVLRVLRRPECRRHPWMRPVFIGFLFLLHSLEINAWPLRFAPPQYSPFFERVAREPGEFAILDVPYQRGMHQYMHYGAYHQKKVIWGFGSRVPDYRLRVLESAFRFPGIVTVDPETWDPNYVRFARSLLRYRVKYIVLHELHLKAHETLREIRRKLLDIFDDSNNWKKQAYIHPPILVYRDRVVRVYQVVPLTEPVPEPIPIPAEEAPGVPEAPRKTLDVPPPQIEPAESGSP